MPQAARKERPEASAKAENLQARYKPIGLRAVVAAAQWRKDAAVREAAREAHRRDRPAVPDAFYD